MKMVNNFYCLKDLKKPHACLPGQGYLLRGTVRHRGASMCACITRNEHLTEELHLCPRFRASSNSRNAFFLHTDKHPDQKKHKD
jgi:hypothetical protein